ncbi:hypothetical protein DY000_02041019 [Brassica cretica]|uniref:Uncharacterized protein n=1 Tax=Brassica cretica TaxID=69181 RepID=A0ABQ7BQH9_BRACR|nr:hypothetical protein DY000_02041019 [Brassica cretica]
MSKMSGIEGQILEVTVVGCQKSKDIEWFSRQNPYVVLEYSNTTVPNLHSCRRFFLRDTKTVPGLYILKLAVPSSVFVYPMLHRDGYGDRNRDGIGDGKQQN